jgi:murein DD-endopeptidase MepM/ murein hydrolase activator NlpD
MAGEAEDARHRTSARPRARSLVAEAAQQAAEHQQVLGALFDQAEDHEQEEQEREQERAERAAALAAVGWTGDDVDDAVAVRPITSYYVSAGFGVAGPRWASVHSGLDLAAPTGTTIVAAADATVTSVGDAGAYGLRTVLTLEDGTELWYCHQSASLVTAGDVVGIADPVGLVGSTGNSTGPPLHLEVRPGGGAAIDPVPWFAAHGIQF